MKTFTSLKGALALTALAWLSELWRTLIDASQGFHSNATEGSLLFAFTAGYALVLAGWAYALYSASHGSRGGLLATFVLNAFMWLAVPLGTVFFYCPGFCDSSIINIANALNLLLGLLAGGALAMNLWRKSRP
ncbi:MAG: hypothetical protein AAB658_08645 [Chloroflexota bacterium]